MPKKIALNGIIPESLYKKFIYLMPICCVDIILKAGNSVYLFKRSYSPAKDEWWFIGGRVLKGESLKDAAIRKMKEEVGVETGTLRMVGVYENFFLTSRFDSKKRKIGTHAISVCFVAEPKDKNFKLKLNEEYTDYKLINKAGGNLHPYIQAALKDSGVLQI